MNLLESIQKGIEKHNNTPHNSLEHCIRNEVVEFIIHKLKDHLMNDKKCYCLDLIQLIINIIS